MRNYYLLATSGLSLWSCAAFAQSVPAPAAPQISASETDAIEDIVVTAQKRSENLQSVPLSVTALSSKSLENSGIKDLQQVAALIPGLNVRDTAGAFGPTLRGVGTANGSTESPVALFIDNVYIPASREGMRDLDEIEQIAVLKGPQGTLFGRNATGGVIQITTLTPSDELRINASASLDNYLLSRSHFYISGGLADRLAASLSVTYQTQGKGWGDNISTNNDTYILKDYLSLRGKLYYHTDNTKATLSVDYLYRKVAGPYLRTFPGTKPVFNDGGPLGSVYDSASKIDPSNKFLGGGASFNISHDMGFADIISTTSYRRGTGRYVFNVGSPDPNSPTGRLVSSPDSPNKDYTQELQLISPKDQKLTWVVGAFYYHGILATHPTLIRSPFFAIAIRTTETTDSFAPYGQIGWEFTPDTTLTLGARYTFEKRKFHGTQNFPVPTVASDSLSFEQPTFRVALDHKFGDNIMAYASVSTGFKSGGFNILSLSNPPYLSEKLTDYEAGIKSQLFGNRLRFNIGLFNYEYTNLQIVTYSPPPVVLANTTNGAKARIYGVDVDMAASLGGGFKLSGGLEWLHSKFLRYPNAGSYIPNPAGGNTLDPTFSATGNRLPLAQNFQGNIALDYDVDTSFGHMNFNISANYSGDYYFEADNQLRQSPYTLLNAAIGWTSPDEHYTVSVWTKNLLDKHVIGNAASQGGYYFASSEGAPRTFGITAKLTF
ncbi:MAG TPA: TonB-dependent receptor [Alphaproteobacteria bacterium]|nr:TonB-dependent receptor [Alphaproteobacteria bacterium]